MKNSAKLGIAVVTLFVTILIISVILLPKGTAQTKWENDMKQIGLIK